jgi:hypothetical protein
VGFKHRGTMKLFKKNIFFPLFTLVVCAVLNNRLHATDDAPMPPGDAPMPPHQYQVLHGQYSNIQETVNQFFTLFKPRLLNNNNNNNEPLEIELNENIYSDFFVNLLTNQKDNWLNTPLKIASTGAHLEWLAFLTKKHDSFKFSFYCQHNNTVYTITINDDESRKKIDERKKSITEFEKAVTKAIKKNSAKPIEKIFFIDGPVMQNSETALTYVLKAKNKASQFNKIFAKLYNRGANLNMQNTKGETVISLDSEIHQEFKFRVQKNPAYPNYPIPFDTQPIQELIDIILNQ